MQAIMSINTTTICSWPKILVKDDHRDAFGQ